MMKKNWLLAFVVTLVLQVIPLKSSQAMAQSTTPDHQLKSLETIRFDSSECATCFCDPDDPNCDPGE